MEGNIKNILVVSDMDGTLLTPDKTILPCDIETIRLFTSLGGNFTVASGRTIGSIGMYKQLAPLIAPAIASGGCLIYDFASATVKKSAVLPQMVSRKAARDMLDQFPGLGAMVMGNDLRLYQLAPSAQLDGLINEEVMTYFERPEEDLPELWNKILFAGPPEMLAEVKAYTDDREYTGVHFVRSSPLYFEMMPEEANKGNALRDLCAIMNISLENTYVIGDYYNDMDMMREAGHAVAMANAPDEVKALADEVTGTNLQGGVGQFLYKLIQRHEG